ncbi:PDZ domain-containing protein [Aminithiophilus ramosus]|uniref:PDZ domain-containing protein n=2 Tax=Synergistales TaxID=649776 RepID=A0A9Q7EWR2_9BACT|nr:PDZ domain-containing protein [Aminithiophilus ramosus]QTX31825.1 PDZ domain-containing protein [Aminithiophilus ramosus]
MNLHTGQNAAGRGVFTIVPYSDFIILSVAPFMISNPGTGFEISNKITNRKDLRKFQEILFQVKSMTDGTSLEYLMATLPQIGSGEKAHQESTKKQNTATSGILRVSGDGVIDEIEKGSIAEKNGLKPGDRILEINASAIDFSKPWLKDIDNRIQSGRSVTIVYERNEERDIVTLKK